MSIELINIHKQFGAFTALDRVNLTIPEGELIALLGPSGCGKTTLLRIIAGLERADSGQVRFYGEDKTHQHVKERGIGFVFQHYALFRHMTVFENIAFGLRVKPRKERPSEPVIRKKVEALLELVQLGWLADRYPDQLSGGQRQRIALARALAVEPKVLLLDEPFGALDANVRKDLRRWLRNLHQELHVTSIFVTHDQEEAMEVASQIVVMNKGHIEQVGSPDAVYEHPASAFVSKFIGNVNVFHGRVHDGKVDLGGWELPLSAPVAATDTVAAFVRPHDVELTRQADAGLPRVTVAHIQPLGAVVRLELNLHGSPSGDVLHVEIPRRDYDALEIRPSEQLYARLLNGRVFANGSGI
ncbi:MAG: sulfate/molybdate ABC transporter ATP-binding protein [Gammaproteobacteria bacterium]|nr:sulfate/molybdate ABC transporter ATP-binding protein [Gammaproteobacteria bacterium]